MLIAIGLLILIDVIVLFCVGNYQRQVQNICRQLAFIIKHDSNMMIHGEIGSKSLHALTDCINEFLEIRKKEHKDFLDKEKLISDTYTNLSHDIRTPLTSLDGYFQLLEKCENQEDSKRYIAVIQERISSLKDMLEELFTFTKLKNGDYQLELSRINVNRILKDTIFSYYEDWCKKKIEPEIKLEKESIEILGNEQALRRIIQNVVKNGIDHGEKKIMISLFQEREHIELKIGNEINNPQDIDTERVFERFYKIDESRSKNSTGLGLSIAKEFVLQMNGKIEAYVKKHEFWIVISFPRYSVVDT